MIIKKLLDLLNPLNIEARYPSYVETVSELISEISCQSLITQT
jgi:hypothetical protein